MTRSKTLLRACAAMITCALAACGGGGGGDGGGGGGGQQLVTANASSFEMVGMAPNIATSNTITFTIHESTPKTYYAVAQSDIPDLTAQLSVVGNTTADVELVDQSGSNTVGVRSGTITFTLCTDEPCKSVVWTGRYPVHYSRFSVDTSPVTLAGQEGATTTQVVTVTPPDTQHLLSVTTSQGFPSGAWLTGTHDASGNIVLTASGVGLTAANYTTTAIIGVVNSSAYKPVSFNVGVGLYAPALADIVERVNTSASDLHGSGNVAFAGAGGTWTATSDSAWLVIDTPAGSGPGAFSYHVDVAAADHAVANWGSLQASIRLQSPGLTDAVATLNYKRQLPEISMVTPSQVLPGQPATVRVTGRGLSQLSIGQIQVGTLSAAGTVDSDTSATLQLPALAAGSLQVRVPSALGVPSAQANLAVAANVPAAVTPSTNSEYAIVYDPSRQAVYGSSYFGSVLQRWTWNGSGWGLQSTPWSGILRIALSPDRQTLWVVAMNGLFEVDPDSFAVRDSWSMTASSAVYRDPLSITADQRLFLPEFGWKYFDLRTRTVNDLPYGANAWLNARGMVAAADGAHLLVTNNGFGDGWYTAATQSLSSADTGGYQGSYSLSSDNDGGLVLEESSALYVTSSWMLAGTATLPATEQGYGGVVSPDGRRVYRLAGSVNSYQGVMDHIDVFDTTQLQAGTSQFVLVGTIALHADAVSHSNNYGDDATGRLAIDPLGKTLFWAGDRNFVVISIPQAMSGIAAAHKSTAKAWRVGSAAAGR